MMSVKEVSRLSGVSVRALHHYDAIGLLRPTSVTEAGYRLYDEEAVKRLQTILLFRKLQFPLKQIREILDSPGFDPVSALTQQIKLLELQRDQLDILIAHARKIQKTGVMDMNFKPFDTSETDEYAAQAKAKWSTTDAYKEFENKTKGQTPEQILATGEALMDIFTQMGRLRHLSPAAPEVQAQVAQLQAFITGHYYTCSPRILKGLGRMYIADDSMRENIDKAGGEGTAEFAGKAIEIYTK